MTLDKLNLTTEQKHLAASIINNFGSGNHPVALDSTIGLFTPEYIIKLIDRPEFQASLIGQDDSRQKEVAELFNVVSNFQHTHKEATAAVDKLGEFVDAIADGSHSDILIKDINDLREKHKYLLIRF